MYRSPIDIIYADMSSYMDDVAKKLDEDIWQAIVRYDVNIDKEELIRALQYDRDQYQKGYADGEADAAPRWISVKERLPESGKKVLGTKMGADRKFVFLGKYSHDRWIDVEWSCYRYGVTHWMPLPEPPKEENDG